MDCRPVPLCHAKLVTPSKAKCKNVLLVLLCYLLIDFDIGEQAILFGSQSVFSCLKCMRTSLLMSVIKLFNYFIKNLIPLPINL